jgi:hypothetical protein
MEGASLSQTNEETKSRRSRLALPSTVGRCMLSVGPESIMKIPAKGGARDCFLKCPTA